MFTRSKFLVLPWASPQLHPVLQSTTEYTKMSMFLSRQHTLNSSGVLYIDDGNAIWDAPPEISEEESNIKYDEFKAVANNSKGLAWEFTEMSNSVNFLDLTLTIVPDGHIKTKLFEKPVILHLYIPTHSMHPP